MFFEKSCILNEFLIDGCTNIVKYPLSLNISGNNDNLWQQALAVRPMLILLPLLAPYKPYSGFQAKKSEALRNNVEKTKALLEKGWSKGFYILVLLL
ncbi:hypothetical protein ATZ36_00095 [Candidatus Endomicrobiellum trichonymphae]|uniref:Uncharacterized protein n=1 Tax=Endomicrobium trichonymphae TaxID=1408204 RepID=A0A1E5ILJ5_ENDTX|nr:hypothetical protein ATZ36_00095 [Candidatus Endomicrobium trichonymphae]